MARTSSARLAALAQRCTMRQGRVIGSVKAQQIWQVRPAALRPLHSFVRQRFSYAQFRDEIPSFVRFKVSTLSKPDLPEVGDT